MALTAIRGMNLQASLACMSAATALAQKGFFEMPMDPELTRSRMIALRDAMRFMSQNSASCALSPWHYIFPDAFGPKYGMGAGFRLPEEGAREQKYLFQYNECMDPEIRDSGLAGSGTSEFLAALQVTNQFGHAIAQEIARLFDIDNAVQQNPYPGSLLERIRNGNCTTRIVRYGLQSSRDAPDAIPHVDRGTFSIHWWSSHRGLRIWSPNMLPQRIEETNCSKVGVLLGRRFAAATRGKFGFGTPHGVRDERRDIGKRTGDRIAVITFVHGHPQSGDAEWMAQNETAMGAYERSFTL